MVQPPLPEGKPKDVMCGTDAWYKSEVSMYSPKAKLVWMDLQQPGNEVVKGQENWWPGVKRWHLALWLQDAVLELGHPEVLNI